MPGLSTSLRAFDLDQLEQIANFWAVPVSESSLEITRLMLELEMADQTRFDSLFAALPEAAQAALLELKANQGQMTWSAFSLRYGEIRAMGPGKRKKEQPWAFPISVTETLWYRGLIGRDFLRSGDDLHEMAYLPSEFVAMLPKIAEQHPPTLALQAQRVDLPEPKSETSLLNDVCTLLAALRFENPADYLHKTKQNKAYWQLLEALLLATGLLDSKGKPNQLAKTLLEMPRENALLWLRQEWEQTPAFNEFGFLSGVSIHSDEPISLLPGRQKLLSQLRSLSPRQWYLLSELTGQLQKSLPDLLRTQEQFYSWKVLQADEPDQALEGLESWQHVEAAFVRFILSVMLPLFGIGSFLPESEKFAEALFWLEPEFFHLEVDAQKSTSQPNESQLSVSSTGNIVMTDRSPLILRYQLSRFLEWESIGPTQFNYQLSPRSLSLAKKQGLLPKHLISLLRKNAQNGLPPILYQAIKRWESEGAQAKMEKLIILQLANPDILQALRETSASRWLGEAMGPSTVVIKPGGQSAVRSALASLGILADWTESDTDHG